MKDFLEVGISSRSRRRCRHSSSTGSGSRSDQIRSRHRRRNHIRSCYVQNIHHCRRHSSSTGSGSGRSYCTRFLRFHTRIHNHNRSLLPLHHSLLVPPSSMFDYTASYDPQLARVSMFCKNFRKFFLVRAVFCSIIGAFSGSL